MQRDIISIFSAEFRQAVHRASQRHSNHLVSFFHPFDGDPYTFPIDWMA
jgi:hypothetical protein